MKKGIPRYMAIILGIILFFLGLLWFIQGMGIIQMCPILCFADCECITGGSVSWTIIGAITFIVGLLIIFRNSTLKKIRNK